MLHIGDIHSMDEYLDLLSKSTKIYIDNDRLDNALKEAQYLADDFNALALLEMRIEASGSYTMLSPDNIIDFLESLDVDVSKMSRKTKGISLDRKRVIDPLIERGVAVNVLEAYKKYKSFKSYASNLRKGFYDNKHVYTKTNDGRIILDYNTTIVERENLRVYYKDVAVVSIPKIFSSIVTTPNESYHLAWCDYPQADWRFAFNLFIKDDRNFDIMSSCADAYEGLARIVEGDNFNEEDFKNSRKEYKVNCLKVFYNSKDKHPIPKAMRDYYLTCERYKNYVYDLSVLYEFKLPVPCTTYFGYTQMIPEGAYPDAFISKGLNTPIQTFTSHVVIETVFGLLNKFYSLGYTEDDIKIYYVRHDEIIFMFKDTILKDAWVFEDCSEIHIDGFSPIRLDFHYGNNYQEEDSYLTKLINDNIDSNKSRIMKYDIGKMHEYNPTPSVESVYAQFFYNNEKENESSFLKVHYYDYRKRVRYVLDSKSMDKESAIYDTLDELLSILNYPKYLLIKNDAVDLFDRVGPDEDIILRVLQKYDSSVTVQRDGEL